MWYIYTIGYSVQFSLVAQSCPTLCDPMNCSIPGLPVSHQLPEFIQTHVHRLGDAIHPSHPLSSPFPPAPIPPSIRVFSNESTLHMRWPKYWSFSFSITFPQIHKKYILLLGTKGKHMSHFLSKKVVNVHKRDVKQSKIVIY